MAWGHIFLDNVNAHRRTVFHTKHIPKVTEVKEIPEDSLLL